MTLHPVTVQLFCPMLHPHWWILVCCSNHFMPLRSNIRIHYQHLILTRHGLSISVLWFPTTRVEPFDHLCEGYRYPVKMIAVQRCPIMSSLSSQDYQHQSFLSDSDHDHSDDTDNDIQQFWWDDLVTEFPANYYTLLTPEEYNELFNDDENDVDLPGSDEEDDDELKTDDDPSHSFMPNFVFKSAAAAEYPSDKMYDDILKSSPSDAAAIYCAYRSYTTHNNAPRSYTHQRIYAATYVPRPPEVRQLPRPPGPWILLPIHEVHQRQADLCYNCCLSLELVQRWCCSH